MKDFFSFNFNFKTMNDRDEGKWIPRVRRDWAIIVCVTFVMAMTFASFHLFLYLNMTSKDFFSQKDSLLTATPDRIQQAKLNDALSAFQKKKENFDAIIANPVPFQDPSVSKGGIVSPQTITPPSSRNTQPSSSPKNTFSSLPQPTM